MSRKHDGGPAFPVANRSFPIDGMSLRDYFAAAVLPWCLGQFPSEAEKVAYRIADQMLKERDRD